MRAQKRPRLIAVPRDERPAEIPLAPLQRRLWIIDAIEGGSPEYHNVLALRLTGALDEAALDWALTRLFIRHEVMRTRLPSRAGEPRQEIAEPGPIDLTRADLSDLPEREREPRAKELLAAEQLRPYDLAAGPLARCLLVRLSDTDHVLAIAMHHVICDAGSFEVILSELDAGYRAALAGQKTPPEPLEVQYADYALWQCALEASGAWERQRKFWAERLEGVTGELPGLCDLDAANGAAKPPGETIGHEFAPETAAELRRLGDGIAVTPFMIVAAAFAAALAPYAVDDTESLIVGIPFDARHDRRLRPLVGMFINTLPIPLSLRAPSFHALLEDARTRLLEAYGNADLPYDAMVREIASSRAGPGLFQTMCQLQHADAGSVTVGDLIVTPFPAAPQPAKFDLTLNAVLRGVRLTCDFTYATDRLSRRRAEEVTARFAELLANAVGDPARPVGPAPHAGAVAVAPRAGEERDAHTPGVEAPAELEELVRGFFAEILGLPEVARDADFFALGGHSLIAIKLMRRINDSVPGKVPVNLVFRRSTPRELASAIAAQERERAGSTPVGDNTSDAPSRAEALPAFVADAWLPPDVTPPPGSSEHGGESDFVLLTGATGFLGSHLLAALLERTKASVVCLVRTSPDEPDGRVRLRRVLERNRIWRDEWEGRIDVVTGDLGQRRFGLGEAGFARLARGIDAIYHVGADVNIAAEYERLRPVNVDGTIEVLRLARDAGAVPVSFVSTLSTVAGGPADPDPLPEEWTSDPQRLVPNGYVYSKWVAERLVQLAAERGMPVTVFRPSRIAGSRDTGATATQDAFWHYVRACLELGAVPADAEIGANLVPVDYVARAIVELSRGPAAGPAYNIRADSETQLAAVVARARKQGHSVEETDYETWIARAESQAAANDASSDSVAVVSLLGAVAEAGAGVSTRATSDWHLRRDLAASGLTRPDIDAAAIDRMLDFLHETGFLPNPGPTAPSSVSRPVVRHRSNDVVASIDEAARQTPRACALRDGATEVSYQELVASARAVADELRAGGVRAGDRVGVSLDLSPALVSAILGALFADAAFVVLPPEDSSRRMEEAVRELALSHLIGAGDVQSTILPLQPSSTENGKPAQAPKLPAGAPAYVILTSGSTGRPKAVQVSRHALARYIEWAAARYLTPRSDDGCPLFTSLAVDLTLTSLFAPLAAGRTVELVSDGIDGVAERLAAGRSYDFVKCTPSHLYLLCARVEELGLRGSVRCLVLGGESLRGDPVARWRAISPATRVVNEYGPTEATVGCCVHELVPSAAVPDVVPIGRAIPGAQLEVLDDDGREQTGEATGELAIGGEGLADGYVGRGDLTASAFVPASHGTRRYTTGDLVHRDPDGTFHFLGRRDDQLKVRGHRIEPAELEAAVRRCAGIAECAVTCWERDVDDRRLVAFVTEDATARLGLAERLLETVRAELPSQFIPAHVFRVDRLPRTAAGKLQRRGLAGTYLDEVIAHGQGEGPGIGTVVDLRHRASVVIRRGS